PTPARPRSFTRAAPCATRKSSRPPMSTTWRCSPRESATSATDRRMDAGTERIYGLRELTRILNLTPKRLGQLRRLDLMKDAAGWNNLGLLLHRMGRYDEARAAYDTAVARDPSCAEAAYNLGSLAEDQGDVEGGIAHYRRALEVSPDYADAHFNLAAALARSG